MGIRPLQSGRFVADHHTRRGGRVRRTFRTRTEAKRWLIDMGARAARGEAVKRSTATVAGCFAAWREWLVQRRSPAYVKRCDSAASVFLPWLNARGCSLVAKLDLRVLDKYERARREHGRAGQTILNECRTMCAALSWCASRGLIERNPLAAFRPPDRIKHDVPAVPAPDELQRIFDNLPSDAARRAIWGLLALGCRVGAFAALRAEHVTPGGRLAFTVNVKRGQTYKRDLPAFPFALPRAGVLFPDESGSAWKEVTLLRHVHRACDAAKVPRIRLHTCRNAFATYALAAGEPSTSVMVAGGWRSLRMVERYLDLSKDYRPLLDARRAGGYLPRWPDGAQGGKTIVQTTVTRARRPRVKRVADERGGR
ncbi:tyrosine-type recombinase/integrase [bacterium]|nr:tyrosine-type recombinase/integrase [bacterium]